VSPDASGNRRRRNAATTDSTFTASERPGRLRYLLAAVMFEFAQPEARFPGARTGRVGVFVGVLPQPEQQVAAVQGRNRATEQSLSVDRFPRLPASIGRCHASPGASARWGTSGPRMVSATERGLVRGSPMSWAALRASEIPDTPEDQHRLASGHRNRNPSIQRARPLVSLLWVHQGSLSAPRPRAKA